MKSLFFVILLVVSFSSFASVNCEEAIADAVQSAIHMGEKRQELLVQLNSLSGRTETFIKTKENFDAASKRSENTWNAAVQECTK